MTLVFTGGGTLGSVTPLLAIAEEFTQDKKIWIGTNKGPEKKLVHEERMQYFGIQTYKLRRYFSLKTLLELPHLFQAYSAAKKILREEQATLVITAGGFTGVPVCRAARSLKIPYVMLQLDYKVGLANLIVYKHATHVCVALEKHLTDFNHHRVTWCGIPTSKMFNSFKTVSALRKKILFIGGGTGSKFINDFVARNITQLTRHYDVMHITGDPTRSTLSLGTHDTNFYTQYLKLSHSHIAALFSKINCVVSRSGMGILSEIAATQTPALIIPMPKSHQELNAEYFERQGSIITAAETDSDTDIMDKIYLLINSDRLQKKLRKNLEHVLPSNAARCIKNVILTYIPNEKQHIKT